MQARRSPNQKVCRKNRLQASATPKSFWPATKSMKLVQRGNKGDNVTNMIRLIRYIIYNEESESWLKHSEDVEGVGMDGGHGFVMDVQRRWLLGGRRCCRARKVRAATHSSCRSVAWSTSPSAPFPGSCSTGNFLFVHCHSGSAWLISFFPWCIFFNCILALMLQMSAKPFLDLFILALILNLS